MLPTGMIRVICVISVVVLIIIAGPCNGGVGVLTGSNGVFSTKGTYYENNAKCQWKIEVDKRKVRMCQYICEVRSLFVLIPLR